MNKWVKKSVDTAYAPGYLDKLANIYPATPTLRKPLPNHIRESIKTLYSQNEVEKILSLLLNLTTHPFPIEHPYVSLLRAQPKLINQNPEVVMKIGEILLSLGADGIIRGSERPPDLNRQMGPAFKNWLKNHFSQRGFVFLSAGAFEAYQGKAFLNASDTGISEYANTKLGCRITRGRDFLVKVRDKFAIGEARFLSTVGGSQNRDVRETVSFAKDKVGNIIKVAVMDGMVWFDKGMLTVIQSLEDDEPGLSALLLEDFLDSLG